MEPLTTKSNPLALKASDIPANKPKQHFFRNGMSYPLNIPIVPMHGNVSGILDKGTQ